MWVEVGANLANSCSLTLIAFRRATKVLFLWSVSLKEGIRSAYQLGSSPCAPTPAVFVGKRAAWDVGSVRGETELELERRNTSPFEYPSNSDRFHLARVSLGIQESCKGNVKAYQLYKKITGCSSTKSWHERIANCSKSTMTQLITKVGAIKISS